jgi:tetratricopeptide (TPR) repeat protein
MSGVHFLGSDTIADLLTGNKRRHADGVGTRIRTFEGAAMNVDAFRHMVANHPDGFLGRYGLGNKLLQEGGNLEEAVEHLQAAVRLDPVHVASHLALGRALIALERKEEAKSVLGAGIDAALSGRSNGGGDLVPEMRALLQTLG